MDTWTTTPPTEPGWYWVDGVEDADIVRVVYNSYRKRLVAYFIGGEEHMELTDYVRWLGPLPIPAPPH